MKKRNPPRPPRIAEWLLMRIFPDDGSGTSAGDFEESFREIARGRGLAAARAWYWLQFFFSLPALVRGTIFWSLSMLGNSIKSALRTYRSQKNYTLINLTGLTAGIACCLVIFLFVVDELSFDKYHENLDRIHRVAVLSQRPEGVTKSAQVCAPVAQVLRDHFPQVEAVARAISVNGGLTERGDVKFYEDTRIFADSELFDILTIPFLKGNPDTALDRPATMVITERLVVKYFGREEPLGQTLRLNNRDYEITGVVEDPPRNTHFPYECFISMKTLEGRYPFEQWFLSNFYVYVKLHSGVEAASLAAPLAEMAGSYAPKDLLNPEERISYLLQPVADIHLFSHARSEASPGMDPLYLYLFSAIGLFVLLIACINFINLSTARSAERAREVGVRKVMGAGRPQLIRRFFVESLLIILSALILALAAVAATIPLVNSLSGKSLSTADLLTSVVGLFLLGLALFLAAAASTYPAVYLSSFQPAHTLRDMSRGGSKSSSLRRVLVVLQFSITTTLIVGTLVVFGQVEFMKNRELGFDKNQKMVIPVRGPLSLRDNGPAVKQAFRQHAGVTGASAAYKLPGTSMDRWDTAEIGGATGQIHVLNHLYVCPDYIPEFKIGMAAGRAFSQDIPSDINHAFILNRTAADEYGWTPGEAVGKRLESILSGTVIGVTEDFHYLGLQNPIEPLALIWRPEYFNYIILSFHQEALPDVLTFSKKKWNELFPGYPFDFYFLDTYFNRQYSAEERIRRMFTVFTVLGGIIACLGLFGLASYTAEQKTKEIGIRKVLGAARFEIILQLAWEFVKWVLLANVFALPAAYLIMNGWLRNFAYRTHVSPLILAVSALAALIIALVTVSWQAFRAASADPIRSLRYE